MVSKHLGLSRQSGWLCLSSVASHLAQWATMKLPAVACVLAAASLPVRAEEGAASSEAAWVILEETDDSLCLAHGGKLITLALTDSGQRAAPAGLEVWVDRWFMQVQTADHTRHQLTAEHLSQELGCSQSIAGPQHWTLSTIKRLPEQAHP
jgi:hypothetical protein